MAAQTQSTPLEESVEEIVEEVETEEEQLDEDQVDESVYKGMDAFGRGVVAKSRGGKAGEYISKKAKERSDLNKKNDPSMAKRGYALSVTDRDKAIKKAKKRGLNPKYPSQKYGKPNLPEEMVDEAANAKRIARTGGPSGRGNKGAGLGSGKSQKKGYNKHLDIPFNDKKVNEKTLTPAEKKKREEIAKAIERDNPKMPMDKKMAIATATAKKVAESSIKDRTRSLIERAINRKT
jgi:hypothetical protein